MSSATQNQPPSSALQEDDEAYCSASFLWSTEAFTQALSTCVSLGLFDIIGSAGSDASLTATEITAHLHAKNPDFASDIIDRMLKLLACYDLLSCSLRKLDDDDDVQRQYGLSPTGKFFVRKADGTSSLPLYAPDDRSWEDAWYKLKDAILEGDKNPYEKAHGVAMYERMSSDQEQVKGFNKSMDEVSSYLMNKILVRYNGFEGIKTLVDIGGGSGLALCMILSKYPQINAINFDLTHVIKEAPSHPGVKHVGGDMFLEIPSADAIMMKDVLHNHDDEECIKILKNCYNALAKGGKVIVVSHIMAEVAEASSASKFVCQLDVMMFVYLGGKQRTEKQFKNLSKAAGFSGFKLACYAAYNALAIIEFYK